MGKLRGNLIAEYGLILALVALVAITSLAYLGGVLDQSYAQSGNLGQANELFGLLGGRGIEGGETTNPAAAVQTASVEEGIQAYAEAGITGDFKIPIGSANLASSAEGSEKIAEMFRIVAETGIMPDGTNLAEEIGPDHWFYVSSYLRQMAEQGKKIADAEKSALAAAQIRDGSSQSLNTIQNTSKIYADLHNQLQRYIDTINYQGTHNLKHFANQASGAITYGAKAFVGEAGATFSFNQPFQGGQFDASASMTTIGYSYQPGDVVTIPVDTQQKSDGLNKKAEAPVDGQ